MNFLWMLFLNRVSIVRSIRVSLILLRQSSRRVFGMIKGENVGLLLDASNTNLGYGRDKLYRENLVQLIDEQLSAPHIKTLFVVTYGSCASTLWPVPMTVNGRILDELKTFVQKEMVPSGSSNLLDGIKMVRGIFQAKYSAHWVVV